MFFIKIVENVIYGVKSLAVKGNRSVFIASSQVHWVPLTTSSVTTSTCLQRVDFFDSKSLTAMLKSSVTTSSVTTSTCLQRVDFFDSKSLTAMLKSSVTTSSVTTSTCLQRVDFFDSKSLTAMLKSSVTTSTLLQRAVFLASTCSL